jgi:hypothetical protein
MVEEEDDGGPPLDSEEEPMEDEAVDWDEWEDATRERTSFMTKWAEFSAWGKKFKVVVANTDNTPVFPLVLCTVLVCVRSKFTVQSI